MNEAKDIRSDNRFTFPVPGNNFLYKGDEVDLAKVTEARALQLANDPSCKFIKLANAAGKVASDKLGNGSSPASSGATNETSSSKPSIPGKP